jgi:UDP-N-acetylglucosamine--dolichyl-phosphate N-acetylglucosaminephosphotransferase
MLSIFISFFIVYLFMPWFIKYLTRIGLVVKDQHKEGKPLIPLAGGIVVFLGIFFAIMFAIFVQTFYYHTTTNLISLLAFISSLFAITFIGFIDDLLVRKDHEASIGLKQWQKPLLTVIAAIPLMVINAGVTTISLPFFGLVNFGILYPLILIPIGVVGASNMVNLLAGFNGLESGLALIYLSNLSVYAYVNGAEVAALIGAVAFAAVLAFWYFNFVPARIFPGDSLTYLLGGVIVSMAILGNMETAAIIVSVPFFIECILKFRGRFKKQSYGFYFNGKVKSLYDKIYSLPHIWTLSGKFTEKQVVLFVYALEAVCCLLIWII